MNGRISRWQLEYAARELESAPPRRFGPPAHDQRGRHRVLGDLAAPRGLGTVVVLKRLQRLAPENGPVLKASVPGPYTLSGRLLPNKQYPDRYALTEALLPIVRAELEALVALSEVRLHRSLPFRAGVEGEDGIGLRGGVREQGLAAALGGELDLHLVFGLRRLRQQRVEHADDRRVVGRLEQVLHGGQVLQEARQVDRALDLADHRRPLLRCAVEGGTDQEPAGQGSSACRNSSATPP